MAYGASMGGTVLVGWLALGAGGFLALELDARVSSDVELQLLDRLLARGHRVYPEDESAAVQIRVDVEDRGYVVVVQSSTRTVIRVPTEPPRLRRLELAQRVGVEVSRQRVPARPQPSRPAVVIPSSRSVNAPLRRELLKALWRDGHGITERALAGDVLLCIRAIGHELHAGASRAPGDCTADEVVSVEVLGARAAALVRSKLDASASTRSAIEEPESRRRARSLELGAFGGVSGPFDARAAGALGLLGHIGWGGRWGLAVGLSATPTSNDEAAIVEAGASAGPALRWRLSPRWRLTGALRLGANLHAFDVPGGRSGLEVDLLSEVPLELSCRVLTRSRLGFLLVPAVVSRSRRHLRGQDVIWEAGVVRLTAGLAISHDFPL
jgi:hypothetical protein